MLMGLERIERFKENEVSSLCEVLCCADSSYSEVNQPPHGRMKADCGGRCFS